MPGNPSLHECSKEVQGEFLDAASLLEQGKVLSMPLSRNLSSIFHGLHELRFKDRGGQVRFFYFIKKGDAIYLLHAMKKKTRELILRRSRRFEMAWKETSFEKLAKSLGVNPAEVREKQKLIELIAEARKDKGISQAILAKKLGVSQGRIAQIESGVGTAKVSFDVLLNVLRELGFDFKIVPKRVA